MKTKIIIFISIVMFSLTGCSDILDRPQLNQWDDETFWTSETNLRLYANGFYERYFVGYNREYSTQYTAHLGYLFNDDVVSDGNQTYFEQTVPNSRGNNTDAISSAGIAHLPWLERHTGPDWNFSWLRKANIMLDRIETRMGGILSEEAKNHWNGIVRFFRAMDYAGLVSVFGDVPYYDHEIKSNDYAELYKPRTPRNQVMDAVYDDFVFALNNVRTKAQEGAGYVNQDVVAAFTSRWALFEGTWQKYHNNDAERAKKFLNLAVTAASYVIGKYSMSDFRSLFGSNDLASNPEVIFYRHYDGVVARHSIATSCNMADGRYTNANLALIKAFICIDGSDWQTSADAANKDFSLDNLIKTRDPRFEATFYKKPTLRSSSSCLYTTKFISREGLRYLDEGTTMSTEYSSANNKNDYPVMRYAEVLLNWIEAKAELATLGGAAVTQDDIDNSINIIRNRPLDADAIANGVTQKTAAMNLNNLPSSPDRGDVPQLIWEIRRERRMEFFGEHSRLLDLKRWKKLEYMDNTKYPDILRGTWIDASEISGLLVDSRKNILAVTDMDGNRTVYDGANGNAMKGFYSPTNIKGRLPFLDVFGTNPYLAPVGRLQRIDYRNRGFELAQTEGWSDDL
ncbi:MAG: RagB/SusD family nutrient uptake outer membrane protein [Prevotellaceae bacterium]|nr:RagB/SusD family nutrient uptake outer membrane protein [Prevotellaceae bacterium]